LAGAYLGGGIPGGPGVARGRDTGNNPPMATKAYIALGSNLGDRRGHLTYALEAIRVLPGVLTLKQSPVYETDPIGGPAGQGKFLNSVAAVNTDLTATQLLYELHRIEADRGRDRDAEIERCGPRPLDLDILLFGDEIIDHPSPTPGLNPNPQPQTPNLTVPHPRMHQRWFVLKPLCDLAPDLVHPVLKRTASELLAEL